MDRSGSIRHWRAIKIDFAGRSDENGRQACQSAGVRRVASVAWSAFDPVARPPTDQRNTKASPPGSSPRPNADRHPRVAIGKRSGSRERRATARLCLVSAARRMTRSMPRSRCFAAIRRSSAWTSSIRVSASTIARRAGPSMTASALRRSPGIGIGTSVRQRSPLPRRGRKRSRRARCAASRTGFPSGCSVTLRRSPRAAAILAAISIVIWPGSPRSIRPTFV